MKTFKKIARIIMTIVFVIGIVIVIKNYSVMISNNIKSKSYNSVVGIYAGNESYSYFVDDEKRYECKVNIYKKDRYPDMATVKYNQNNPEECTVPMKSSLTITGWVVITFILGIALIVLKMSDRKSIKK